MKWLTILLLLSTTLPIYSQTSKSYSYTLSSANGWPVISFQLFGFNNEIATSIIIDSTMNLEDNGIITCFGIGNSEFSMSQYVVEDGHYINNLTIERSTSPFVISSNTPNNTCGQFLYNDPNGLGVVMPSQAGPNFPIINPQVLDIKVVYTNGSSIILSEVQATPEQDPGYGKMLLGYFATWSIYNGQSYDSNSIPVHRMNGIDYAFIYFDTTDGHVYAGDYNSDSHAMPGIAALVHQHSSYLKGYLAFGGWTNYVNGKAQFTDQRFTQMTSNSDGTPNMGNINNFAKTAVNAMAKLGFSGIDIDWEWWASTNDTTYDKAYATRMLALYQAIRDALDAQAKTDGFTDAHHYKLLVALPISHYNVNAQEKAYPGYWKSLYSIADYFSVMSYDMHGDWDYDSVNKNTKTYFQAAFNDINDSYPTNGSSFSILKGLAAYKQYVPDMSKFCLGIPAYGRGMVVGNASTVVSSVGVNQQIILGPIPGGSPNDFSQRDAQGSSSWDYECIIDTKTCAANSNTQNTLRNEILVNQSNHAQYNDLWKMYNGVNDDGTDGVMQPWAYAEAIVDGASHWMFFSYDDINSATLKTNYALSQNFSGISMWELDGDHNDNDKSLLQAISNAFAKHSTS